MYLIFVKPLSVNTVMSPNLSYLVLLTVFGIKDSIGIKSTVPSFLRIMIGVSGSTLSPYKTSMPTDLHFSIVSNMVYLPTPSCQPADSNHAPLLDRAYRRQCR